MQKSKGDVVALRPYQESAVGAVLAAREGGVQRALITLPTGTGKTLIAAALAEAFPAAGPVLFLAHREELLEQAWKTFRRVSPGITIGIEKGHSVAYRGAQVVLASVQTVGRNGTTRLGWLKPSLVYVDEAHRAPSASYQHCFVRFGCYRPGGAFLCGLTATPKRLDQIDLKQVFQEHVFDYPLKQAIRDKWLVQIRGYRVRTTVDLDDVRTSGEDFVESELAKRVNVDARNKAAIQYWAEEARERPTIAFCANVEHAQAMAALYRVGGVSSEAVWGAMRPQDRRAVARRFEEGRTQVLTNCDLLTEGFDSPKVACIVMARPTKSWTRYVQAIGRGLRLYPGKQDCKILDVVDNCKKHDLATVPAILDLPADLDLQGNTLLEAADLLEELGAKAVWEAQCAPKTFTELSTTLETVDLLDEGRIAPEVERHSRLSWVRLIDGRYYVSCGGPAGARRSARLESDALGSWLVRLVEGRNTVYTARLGTDPAAVFNGADDVILQRWPEAEKVTVMRARWRNQPPTPKQEDLLRKLGVNATIIARLESSGQASALIDSCFARSNTRR